jgi:hypothetical protein
LTCDRPTVGATRIPATAAVVQPIAHASIAARWGRVPLSIDRARSSTAARIASPACDRCSSSRRPTARPSAVATPTSSRQVTATPSTSTLRLPKNRVAARGGRADLGLVGDAGARGGGQREHGQCRADLTSAHVVPPHRPPGERRFRFLERVLNLTMCQVSVEVREE